VCRSNRGSDDEGQGSVIVTCERCATQFQLDDARVPKKGVRVRCSRCKNSFRVMPPGAAAAEQVEDLARRAREEGEDITQDLPEERSASRSAGGARSAAPQPGMAAGAESSHGPESEESDWEFNNDTAGDLERGIERDAADSKPDPPEVAPSRGRMADDWFGGGAGDAPLELEDRAAAPSAAAPPLPQRPSTAPRALPPVPTPAREPVEPVARSAAAAPVARSAEPVARPAEPVARPAAAAPSREPEPDLDLELADEPESAPRETAPAPAVRVERRAAPQPADELGGQSWNDLLSAAAEADLPAPRAGSAAPGSIATTRLASWLGRFGHVLGSGITLALFGAGLAAGLSTPARLEPAPARVAGLELDALETRFVDNASSGMLFVVSGRVRNPGPGEAAIGRLSLELYDAQGQALGGSGLHAPAPVSLLREGSAAELTSLPRLSGAVRPGEVRSFEAVVASLPAQAREFRIVESQTAPPAAADAAPSVPAL
jgi:predicted Zn finger-like uncharacterized protein